MSKPSSSAGKTLSKLFLVDAFTDEAGRGNPAAVCVMDDPSLWATLDEASSSTAADDRQRKKNSAEECSVEMSLLTQRFQAVAAELGFSETVFVSPRSPRDLHLAGGDEGKDTLDETEEGEISYLLRWFSPTKEVILCGHATMAACHTLITEVLPIAKASKVKCVRFYNRFSGPLSVLVNRDPSPPNGANEVELHCLYQLNFPRRPPLPIIWPGNNNEERSGSSRGGVRESPDSNDHEENFKQILADSLGLSSVGFIEEVLLHKDSAKYVVVLKDLKSNTGDRTAKLDGNRREAECGGDGGGGSDAVSALEALVNLKPNISKLTEVVRQRAPVPPLSVTVTTLLSKDDDDDDDRDARIREEEFCRVVFGGADKAGVEAGSLRREVQASSSTKQPGRRSLFQQLPDIVSRHFAPWVGIPEDPVTGAAHCVVCPYWFEKTLRRKRSFRCYQASPGRGGFLEAHLFEEQPHRIGLTGTAVTVFEGALRMKVLP